MVKPSSVVIEARNRLFEGLHDAVLVFDAQDCVVDLNAAARQTLGLDTPEVLGQSIARLLPSWPGRIEQVGDQGEVHAGIVVDGPQGPRHLEVRLSPLFNQAGQLAGRLVVMHDINPLSQAAETVPWTAGELEPQARERMDELTRANADLQAQIRKHRQAEEAVAAERQRFNDILEMLPAYLVLLRPDYQVSFANRFFRERFGESHGQSCFEYLFGRTEPCENCETYETLKTNAPHRWQWTGPDGRNYDVFDFPFVDTDGATLILEMGIDITERERAQQALQEAHDELEARVEERTVELTRANAQLEAEAEERRTAEKALRESEERFHTIYDTAPVSIWQEDWTAVIQAVGGLRTQGVSDLVAYFQDHPGFVADMLQAVQIVDVNQWTVDMFEARHKAEVLASLGIVFAASDTLPGFVAELTALAAGQQVFRTEMAVNTVRGDTRQILLSMAFPPPGSGSGQVLVSVIDITEHKRNEEQIANLARFPGENPNPILRVSGDGTILYSNGSGHVLLETWNRKVGEMAPPDWQQTVRDALRKKSEKVQDFRCGESIYLVAAVPISEGGYVNLYGRDVTKERESQKALQQAHDELEGRVKERTEQLLQSNVQLRAEIEERIRTEQSLKLEEARLDALLRLSQISETSLSELAGFVLEQGIALTQSKIGFVGLLSEDESIYTLNAVSRDVVKECDVPGDPVQWHIAEAGIWADAIRERRALFINDYSQPHPRKKGLPPGHPYVRKFMVVPILEGERVVAVAGVGNKAADYDSSDERQMALLLNGMWHWVQQNRAREALQEAHDELQASEEQFRQLAENIHEVFWLLEPDTWRVLYVSPAYDAIWGRTRQELYEQPRSFFDTIHPDDRAEVLQDLTSNWQACDREFRILRPDGTLRWIRLRSFPVYNDQGEAYRVAGVAIDRTEQKASEAALLQAERLTVAGKMAASLAHEINNPLQSVIGCLGLLQGALENDRDPASYLQIARQEVKRAAQIVSQLRSLGRPVQNGHRAPTDLNSLLNDILMLNKKHFRDHKVEVTWEPDAGLPAVAAVPDSMRQVFLNLVLNAVDAMSDGGQLRLTTARTESPAGVQVVVADTGTGIPSDVLPHIFEAFYSTKDEGMGVGLSVSGGIVQQHGGRIEVESQPGVGTTFMVWLPA